MLNPGAIGAKNNPRDALRDALMANPKASEAEVEATLWEVVINERGYWRPIFDYWFANTFRHFFVEELSEHSVTVQERRSTRVIGSENRAAVNNTKTQLRSILMDHVLSNGKRLREATFGECGAEGGWLQAIAKCGKANEIVGKKLTEADLHNLQKRMERKRAA